MKRPLVQLSAVAAGLALLLLAVVGHAQLRRSKLSGHERRILGLQGLVPAGDLALSGSSRHLRFLSLAEPGAAFADSPVQRDSEPANGLIAPPRAVWEPTAR